MAILRDKIKHVIYIVKENRTYDQVLGDLGVGNGDPSIVMFPQPSEQKRAVPEIGNLVVPTSSSSAGRDSEQDGV